MEMIVWIFVVFIISFVLIGLPLLDRYQWVYNGYGLRRTRFGQTRYYYEEPTESQYDGIVGSAPIWHEITKETYYVKVK